MLRSHVYFAAFSFFLTPVVVALPQVLSDRRDRTAHAVTLSHNEAVSAPEGEDATEEENQLISSTGLSAEAYPAGPGSTCNKSSHCVGSLVCTTSGACSCPESTPVLLRDTDSFACVRTRRLSEPCVNHIECSQGVQHARCLGSMCRCPAGFVTASDGSACLSESGQWHPMGTVLFPAVLLILTFTILASYGYYRLTTPGGGKHQNFASTFMSHGAIDTQRLRKWFEGWSVKRVYDGSFNRSRIRSFALRAFHCPQSILARWQWPKYDLFGQESVHVDDGRREEGTPILEVTNRGFEDDSRSTLTSHAITSAILNSTDISSLCRMPSTNVAPLEVCTETPKQDRLSGQHDPATTIDDRLPIPKRRTKISTLSTSTMMPCRSMRRRNTIRISNSPASEAPTARTLSGYRESGHNVWCQTAAKDCAEKDARLPQFQTSSVSLFKFTESELCGNHPRRFKSEGLQKPGKRRPRRSASEDPHLLAAKAKEGTEYSSSSYAWSMEPCIPSSESLGVCTESYTVLTDDTKFNELFEDWSPLPSTIPISAFRHGACKHVDRRLLAWNTFTAHNESARPEDGNASMTNPVANAAAHRGPLLAPYISVPGPPAAGKTRCRRGPLTYGMACPAAISATPRSSTGFALSDVASGGHMNCSGEANGRKSLFLGVPTAGPTGSMDYHATQMINMPQSDRGSASLDSALLAAMMRAGRRVEGSYF